MASTPDKQAIQDRILGFLNTDLGLSVEGLRPDSPLLSSHLLDSINFVRLIFFLEEAFQLPVSRLEITAERLDTVESISEFVARKRGA